MIGAHQMDRTPNAGATVPLVGHPEQLEHIDAAVVVVLGPVRFCVGARSRNGVGGV